MRRLFLKLSGFQARHFKAFVDTSRIDIKPITLLFGHNSSGKSALLSILPMLQQTIEDPNPGNPFVFASERGVDLGTYDEVAHQHQVSLETPIWFILELKVEEHRAGIPTRLYLYRNLPGIFESLDIDPQTLRLEIAAAYNKKRRQIAITDFKLLCNQNKLVMRVYRKTTAATQKWHFEPDPILKLRFTPFWEHFSPYILPRQVVSQQKKVQDYEQLYSAINACLMEELSSLVYIGPLRAFPERAYRLTGASPRDVGQAGQNWLNILLQARAPVELARTVNHWLERLGYTLRIEWGKQGYVHPMLKDAQGLETSLKDVGFGISQILPLLVQGFTSRPQTILILEQPEIHLHPRAQAELGDVLIAIAKRGLRLLVETHSEHLLLRLRRRIAEERLRSATDISWKSEDTAIYFIEKEGTQSEVYQVPMDLNGEFVDPPERFKSFFAGDYEETIKWTEAVATMIRETKNNAGRT